MLTKYIQTNISVKQSTSIRNVRKGYVESSRGLVDSYNQQVVGSNTAVYCMDVSNKASYNIEKENNKGS